LDSTEKDLIALIDLLPGMVLLASIDEVDRMGGSARNRCLLLVGVGSDILSFHDGDYNDDGRGWLDPWSGERGIAEACCAIWAVGSR
jgi:hypothetical protein